MWRGARRGAHIICLLRAEACGTQSASAIGTIGSRLKVLPLAPLRFSSGVLAGRNVFQVHAVGAPVERRTETQTPAIVELPTSDESDKLLRIRHSVRCMDTVIFARADHVCEMLAVCPHYGHGSAAALQRCSGHHWALDRPWLLL